MKRYERELARKRNADPARAVLWLNWTEYMERELKFANERRMKMRWARFYAAQGSTTLVRAMVMHARRSSVLERQSIRRAEEYRQAILSSLSDMGATSVA